MCLQEALTRASLAHQAINTLVLVFQPALLTDYERLDWHTLCSALLGHARSNLLLDVMFDAVRTLYRMVSPLSYEVMLAQLDICLSQACFLQCPNVEYLSTSKSHASAPQTC